MWSANSGTPRSTCICLLLTYQGVPAARGRHLDCNTCNLRTRERATDLHAGHAYSIIGQCWILSWFQKRDHSSMLPRLGKVVGAENRVEDTGEVGNRSLGKMLQCPFRDTVRTPDFPSQAKPSQSVNCGRRLARSAIRRPPVC